MTQTNPEMVFAAAKHARQAMRAIGSPFVRGDHLCIAAARITLAVLGSQGIQARPYAVTFSVFNAAAQKLVAAGIPASEWPEDAWSMGTRPDVVGIDPVNGDYNGHIVLLATVDGVPYVVDPSADQFHREGHIESTQPIVFPAVGVDPLHESQTYVHPKTNVMFTYVPNGDRAWTRSRDWRESSRWVAQTREAIAALEREIRQTYGRGS